VILAQLKLLYCDIFPSEIPYTKQVLYETLTFVVYSLETGELTSPGGAFYSALDADSEAKEKILCVVNEMNCKTILKDDFEFVR